MVDNKLLVVYNTCGISGRENVKFYTSALNSILAQQFDGMRVVISDCLSSEKTRNTLKYVYGNDISYNFIDEKLPVNVTFNHSVLEGVKKFGEFEGYLYVDSGVHFVHNKQIQLLYNLVKSDPYGMVSARVDQDSGYGLVFGFGKFEGDTSEDYKLFENGDFVIPIGKGVNLHAQIFSNSIYKEYGRVWTDIFSSWCSESVFSFICAAIKQKYVISKDVIVSHHQNVDGQSSGFSPQEWKIHGKDTFDHPFLIPSIIDVMKAGQKHGLGYEECQNVVMHDSSHYDENGYCKSDNLKKYIKNFLYLPKNLLDYDRIKSTWI